jgi:hypothetical protein
MYLLYMYSIWRNDVGKPIVRAINFFGPKGQRAKGQKSLDFLGPLLPIAQIKFIKGTQA